MGQWAKRIGDQASDVPSIFFFLISYRFLALKLFIFIFVIFEKINTWNIRRLVADSFVQLAKQPSVNLS